MPTGLSRRSPKGLTYPFLPGAAGADVTALVDGVDRYVFDQWAQDADTSGALVYGYRGGSIVSGASYAIVNGGTVALDDDATNYVERDGNGVVTSNTTGFTGTKTPMAIVVTAAGRIQQVQDTRLLSSGPGTPGGGMGGSGTANRVPKFTAAATIGDSQILDNGSVVVMGTDPGGSEFLRIGGSLRVSGAVAMVALLTLSNGITVSAGAVTVPNASIAWTALSGVPASFTPAAHQLDGALHTVSGLGTGHFLKALTATTFGFAVHGLAYGDVGAAAASHAHAWADITSGVPTTIGGYGITDFNSLGDARWSLLAHAHSGTYEPVLGNPAATGYVLSSTDAGVRSWITKANWDTAYGWGNHASAGYAVAASYTGSTTIVTLGTITTGTVPWARLSDVPSSFTPAAHALIDATGHTASGLTTNHFLKATGATTYGFAAHGLTYSDVGAEVSGATATHAALTTGIHGLAITAGQTLTVTTGGTLGSAAYTASTAYLAAGATAVDSDKLDGQHGSYYAVEGAPPSSHTLASHTTTCSAGQFFKGTGVNTFGWAAHGLAYSDLASSAINIGANALTCGAVNASGAVISQYQSYDGIQLSRNTNNSGGPGVTFFKSRGSLGSPTAVASGDALGQLYFIVYQNSAYQTIGQAWILEVDGAPSGNFVPTRHRFFTSTDAANMVERWRISSLGNFIGLATTAATSTVTGAIVTAGGIGVAGAIYGGSVIAAATRFTGPLIGTTSAVDVVFDRNSVTKLTLGDTLVTFTTAGTFGTNSLTCGALTASAQMKLAQDGEALLFQNAVAGNDLYFAFRTNAGIMRGYLGFVTVGSTTMTLRNEGGVTQFVGASSYTFDAGVSTGALTASGLVAANAGLTVASGQTLTLTGATVTGLTAASVGAGTFPSGAYVFAGALSGITTLNATDTVTAAALSTTSGGLTVGGKKVVDAQGAAVADATDAASVILRLNDLLARVRTHGLIAT